MRDVCDYSLQTACAAVHACVEPVRDEHSGEFHPSSSYYYVNCCNVGMPAKNTLQYFAP